MDGKDVSWRHIVIFFRIDTSGSSEPIYIGSNTANQHQTATGWNKKSDQINGDDMLSFSEIISLQDNNIYPEVSNVHGDGGDFVFTTEVIKL